jgi:sRNA-binding carbon storage regulator CsrA
MTVFRRMKNESLVINDEIILTVIEVRGTRCAWRSSIPRA